MENLSAIYHQSTKEQLKELSTNSMMQTMFPNLSNLANVYLTIPVGTASVEHSFSHMKMVKSRLRNRLGEANLSYLMKIALEYCEALSDEELNHGRVLEHLESSGTKITSGPNVRQLCEIQMNQETWTDPYQTP